MFSRGDSEMKSEEKVKMMAGGEKERGWDVKQHK
jgi:hypothetical protein